MARYIALIDGGPDGYGVAFPDAPGCTAMGATVEEAIDNAAAALAEWVSDEVAAGRPVPPAREMGSILADPDVGPAVREGAVLAVVPLVLELGRAARADLSLDAGLLAAIDEAAARIGVTRSAFLAGAARQRIIAGG